MSFIVHLTVINRWGCPFRVREDSEWLGFFSVSTCAHPQRKKRGGDSWCPSSPNQRTDDPDPKNTPFPPKCPLRDNDKK